MTELETTAKLVVAAVSATGKFAKDEHAACLKAILASPMSPDDKAASMVRIGNVSAIRQQLEAAGVIQSQSSLNAFQVACQKAQAELKTAAAKATK